MPQGLQCFDANGNTVLDITDSLTKLLGTFVTTKVAGSITDENIVGGRFWHTCVPIIENNNFTNFSHRGCDTQSGNLVITTSGSTISWSSPNGYYDQYTRALKVWYGIY